MHFGTKSYLKSTRNHNAKHAFISRIQRRLSAQELAPSYKLYNGLNRIHTMYPSRSLNS